VRRSSVRRLRTFCAAARRLSFKAAAEQLCVTPSAVSHQIKALERELQTQLFERRTRAIALTEHGAKLFAEVEPLLLELDRVTLRFMACVSGSSAEPRAAQTTRERHAFRVA